MLIWLLIIAGVVILDQASKALVMYGLGLDEVGESIPIIKNIFHFTHVRNTGAAFGMLGAENERWIFIVISTIGIIALLIYLWKFRPESKWACSALSMIIGGGIGNMIDRLGIGFYVNPVTEMGEVIDFIDFCGIWDAIFNGADSFVCVGAGLLILALILDVIKESKEEKAKKEAKEDKDEASGN